jgi:hypothetical protein
MPTNVKHLAIYRSVIIASSCIFFAVACALGTTTATQSAWAAPFVALGLVIAFCGASACYKRSYWLAVAHTAFVGLLAVGNLGLLVQFARHRILSSPEQTFVDVPMLAGLSGAVEVLSVFVFFCSVRLYQGFYERTTTSTAVDADEDEAAEVEAFLQIYDANTPTQEQQI